ncbi:MAG: SMP-30/gluconolactonase/LRE family protein [Planctomycetaceae bacterium]|jgi:gluconolactonase|nr:SMP-30/gluconolactonase/LRE family protein [Planctomycetaceae bacterium]MBT6158063.1 SMP-30/gluconolactonase/LRE family protein [Planctomycetaceae bacterium]MBT6486497.1 SMP-30/gluconolactonase/LRE family protein [Planctomycetaceae bacterium]MBT6495820.1 SMP-30/gluconolactonase/LRE family protein [Planctomycetaceae bacterium]
MSTDFHSVALPPDVVENDAAVEPATSIAFTEGPAANAQGHVYFSDIANNRIMRFDSANGSLEVFREPSGRANGLLFDAQGRLLACEGNEWGDDDGNRRLTRTDLSTGECTVLTERFDGARYNAPNDVAACSSGFIFFTDPCYHDRNRMEMEHESVYRISPDGEVTRAISQPDIQRPNGIALSPDEKVLYLVDSCPTIGGNRKIWAFDLADSGEVSNQRVVFDFAPGRGGDGMAVDQQGTLYIAAGIARPRGPHETADVPPGIWIVSSAGELRGRIPIPEDVLTNITFGGDDLRTLYITAGKTLFSVRVTVPGFLVHRK